MAFGREYLKETDHSEDQSQIADSKMVAFIQHGIHLATDFCQNSCEDDNEYSGFVNLGEALDKIRNCWCMKKGSLCHAVSDCCTLLCRCMQQQTVHAK
jgi:hypothetical protein